MTTKTGLVISFAAVVVAATLMLAVILMPAEHEEEGAHWELTLEHGSMFISDAGTAIGGFEFTAEYNVTLVSDNSPVMRNGERIRLVFTLDIGLGDPIGEAGKDELSVTVEYDSDADSIAFEGKNVDIALPYFENDTVWYHTWDGYYIASWGGYAPEEELRGDIAPTIFGLPEHYYVELRMDITVHFVEVSVLGTHPPAAALDALRQPISTPS